jgi:DNA-binding MarR family transcriptional regulator
VRDRVDEVLSQWATERPDLDASPMAVVGRLSRAARLVERGVSEELERHGLAAGEFDLIATLRRNGPPFQLTPGALVASAMVTSGAVTARLDRLVEKGLVTREVDPDNRRSVIVTLTRTGRRLVDRVVEAHVVNEDRLLAPLSARDRERLAALLRTLLVGLGDTA